ncbi:MAG: hypothetical protein HZB56_19215 [Deltaproteobacteria bacterium]|nr:hypothetical protein [Deltaproteobacteria bacterium]
MTTSSEYLKQAVAQAEAAVSSLKDPELRKAGFEKVLESLLGSGGVAPQGPRGHRKGASERRKTTTTRRRVGPKSYVEELISSDFFKKPKQFKAVMEALEAAGHHMPRTTLSPTLVTLCRDKKLRRRKVDGSWEYSNW